MAARGKGNEGAKKELRTKGVLECGRTGDTLDELTKKAGEEFISFLNWTRCGKHKRHLDQGELVTEEMSANPIFSNSVKFNQIHN
jgi:hypothetical protein